MHIFNCNLFEPFHSAFKACHSTETALTKVVNDFLLIMDLDSPTVLLLLDVSAAFDKIDMYTPSPTGKSIWCVWPGPRVVKVLHI